MRFSIPLVLLVSFTVLATGFAQDKRDVPMFPMGPAVTSKIIAEDEYQFSIRQYEPAVPLKIVARDKASYASPESATMALLSAIVVLDFDWFRSIWDSNSNRLMDARDAEMKRDRKFWTDAWERMFQNKRIELVDRIDSGNYVVIAYRMTPEAGEGEVIELTSVLKFQDGRWFETQDLSSDPVLLYWKTPNVRPKRVVRGLKDAAK